VKPNLNDHDKYLFSIASFIVIVSMALLLSFGGCTRTRGVTSYDVNCSQCKFKMTYDVDKNELKKMF